MAGGESQALVASLDGGLLEEPGQRPPVAVERAEVVPPEVGGAGKSMTLVGAPPGGAPPVGELGEPRVHHGRLPLGF